MLTVSIPIEKNKKMQYQSIWIRDLGRWCKDIDDDT
jgi:hypothetical protein